MATAGHPETQRIALLTAVASVLQVAESFLPHPLPGVRLGLANMVTLVALVRIGPRAAMEISVLRTLISSFVLGTFMSPTFILSFCAALASAAAMSLFCRLCMSGRKPLFSLVGVSLVGALTHNLVQLALVYALMVRNAGVFVFLPWLGIGAVVMGWLSGLAALAVNRHLDAAGADPASPAVPGQTDSIAIPNLPVAETAAGPLTAVPGLVKVGMALAVAIAALVLANPVALGCAAAVLFVMLLTTRAPLRRLLGPAALAAPLMVFGFCMVVLFTRHGAVLWSAGPLVVTREGLRGGGIVALRLLVLMLNGALLVRTTPAEELARGLAAVLLPLRLFGISSEKAAAQVTLSLACMPGVWQKARAAFNLRQLRRIGFSRTLDELGRAVAVLYKEADAER